MQACKLPGLKAWSLAGLRAHLHACLHACLLACLLALLDCLSGSADERRCRLGGSQAFRLADLHCRLAGFQACKLGGLHACRLVGLQACKLAGWQGSRFAGLQASRLAGERGGEEEEGAKRTEKRVRSRREIEDEDIRGLRVSWGALGCSASLRAQRVAGAAPVLRVSRCGFGRPGV